MTNVLLILVICLFVIPMGIVRRTKCDGAGAIPAYLLGVVMLWVWAMIKIWG